MNYIIIQFARLWGIREAAIFDATDKSISNMLKGFDSIEMEKLLQQWAIEYLNNIYVFDTADFFDKKIEKMYLLSSEVKEV